MGRLYRIIFLSVALISTLAKAQTVDCEQTIALATEEYNAGHFYNVPSVLNDCLTRFNRDQRQRAFLLLTQTYLLLDDPIGAQRSFLEVLTANPEFIPDEQLHAIDIVYLSKRFTATPKFSWFLGAGSNVSPVSLIRDLDSERDGRPSYKLRPGYNFGAGAEYSYDDNFRLRVETNFFQTSYGVADEQVFPEGQSSGKDRVEFIDRQTWLNIPISVGYSDNIGKYRPYAFAGYSVSKLFADKGAVARERFTNGANGESESLPVSSSDLDFKNRRISLNHSIIFSAGVKYKVGLDFVYVEARYAAGLKNFVDEPNSLSNSAEEDPTTVEHVEYTTPIMAYGHRDNHFRLNNVAISFGFIRPLYKPRELKRAKTKGVLRKVKRAK